MNRWIIEVEKIGKRTDRYSTKAALKKFKTPNVNFDVPETESVNIAVQRSSLPSVSIRYPNSLPSAATWIPSSELDEEDDEGSPTEGKGKYIDGCAIDIRQKTMGDWQTINSRSLGRGNSLGKLIRGESQSKSLRTS